MRLKLSLRVPADLRAPLLKLLAGVVVITALVTGPSLYGAATAGGKLPARLAGASGPSDVVVTLTVKAEVFHISVLSGYGVFGGTQTDRQVVLLQVFPDGLRALSRIYWVRSIAPFRP